MCPEILLRQLPRLKEITRDVEFVEFHSNFPRFFVLFTYLSSKEKSFPLERTKHVIL